MSRIDRLKSKYLENKANVIEIEDMREVELEIYGYYDDENGIRHYKRTTGSEDQGGGKCVEEYGGPV